jgi:deazaflavin-dependent oxidoreductase (nitroreductase family)
MTSSIDPLPAPSNPTPAKRRSLPGPLARFVPPIAGTRVFPLYAVLHHVGRTSGKPYSTAVVARRTADGFVIPLPFGEGTHWAKNLLAAGGGSLRVGGRDWAIRDPKLVDLADAQPAMGPVLGRASKAVGIKTFVRVRTT